MTWEKVVSNLCVLLLIEATLVLFSVAMSLLEAVDKQRKGAATATVIRGERSMGALYSVYLAASASLFLLVDATPEVDDYKVALIVLNFVALAYLFFWCPSFRNRVFFRIKASVVRD